MKTVAELLIDLSFVPSVLLKVTALLALAWLAHFALAGRNPRWRVVLWRVALVGLVALPAMEWAAPALEIGLTRERVQASAVAVDTNAPVVVREEIVAAAPATGAPVAAVTDHVAADSESVRGWIETNWFVLAGAMWISVALVLAARTVRVWFRVRHALRRTTPAPQPIVECSRAVAQRLDVRRRFVVRLLEGLGSPFLTGIVRPIVVLRAGKGDEGDTERLGAVLAHELAHAKTNDPFWMALARGVASLLWFHPLMWRVRSAHSATCEEVCDGVAAAYVGNAESYSKTLACEALALLGAEPAPGGVPMLGTAEIVHRLRKIQRGIRANPLTRRSVTATLLAGAAVLTTLGSLRIVAAQRETGDVQKEFPHAIAIETYQPEWAKFTPGDAIEILEVRGTTPEFRADGRYYVRGRYTLASHDSALVHVYATDGETWSEQGPPVSKGTGEFTRTFTLAKAGMLHVSFYPAEGGEGFGGAYFRKRTADDSISNRTSHAATYPAVEPGIPLAPIEIDCAVVEPVVELPGLTVRLLGSLTATSAPLDPRGHPFDEAAWGITAKEAVDDFGKPHGGDSEPGLGVLFRLRPTRRFDGEYRISRAQLSTPRCENCGSNGVLRAGDRESPDPMYAIFELHEFGSETAVEPLPLTTLYSDISYGPPLDLFADIPADAEKLEIEMGEWTFTATVSRLPESEPSTRTPFQDRPRVDLTFSRGGPLTNFHVVAVKRDGSFVEASNRIFFRELKHGETYTWGFGNPDPISRDLIRGFRLVGYRLQPIIWRNVATQLAIGYRSNAAPGSAAVELTAADPARTQVAFNQRGDDAEPRRDPVPTAGESAPAARTLVFPDDDSLGRVRIKPADSAEEWQMGWEELGPARGEVAVPAGMYAALYLDDDRVEALPALARLQPGDLQLLSIMSPRCRDSDLRHIEGLTELRALILQLTSVDGSGFVHLRGMRNLEELRMGSQTLTDESMAHLGELTSLRWLALWETGISDAGLVHLRPLRNLRFLALNNTEITDAGLEIVSEFSQLEGLQIYQTNITDAGLALVQKLSHLKHLNIDYDGITDRGIERVATIGTLENLWMNSNPVTDAGFAHLAKLTNLEQLYAAHLNITDAGLESLTHLPKLWQLSLSGVGDEGIEVLSRMPALRYLGISDTGVTEGSLPSFQKMAETIRGLSLQAGPGKMIRIELLNSLRAALPECEVWDPSQGPDMPYPGWRAKFEQVYRLAEGEVLRRVAPPFIPERKDYYRTDLSWQAEHIAEPPGYFIFHWDGELTNWGLGFGQSLSVSGVITSGLQISTGRFEGPEELLNRSMAGDWIVRTSADEASQLDALAAIARRDLGVDIHFEKRTESRTVVVVTGSYAFSPLPTAPFVPESIHIVADKFNEDEGSGGGRGTFARFLDHLANHTGMRFLNESSKPATDDVTWRNHRSAMPPAETQESEVERRARIGRLLENLNRQTGLDFLIVERAVDLWVAVEGV